MYHSRYENHLKTEYVFKICWKIFMFLFVILKGILTFVICCKPFVTFCEYDSQNFKRNFDE